MKVKVKKINPLAQLPTRGSLSAAGSDLYACLEGPLTIKPLETILVPTGLAIELVEGTVGLIYARSSLATKNDLAPANKVGVIDSDYRGEILVALHNHGQSDQEIQPDQRIAQLVVTPYFEVEFIETSDLSTSTRNDGGFGSSGQ